MPRDRNGKVIAFGFKQPDADMHAFGLSLYDHLLLHGYMRVYSTYDVYVTVMFVAAVWSLHSHRARQYCYQGWQELYCQWTEPSIWKVRSCCAVWCQKWQCVYHHTRCVLYIMPQDVWAESNSAKWLSIEGVCNGLRPYLSRWSDWTNYHRPWEQVSQQAQSPVWAARDLHCVSWGIVCFYIGCTTLCV